jgi:hypothetical protein
LDFRSRQWENDEGVLGSIAKVPNAARLGSFSSFSFDLIPTKQTYFLPFSALLQIASEKRQNTLPNAKIALPDLGETHTSLR